MGLDTQQERGAAPPDPSAFYLLNEAIAAEVARLAREGHLDRLRAILDGGGLELLLCAADRAAGLEEVVGALRPRRRDDAGGWDHEGFLALRSRFTVTYADGTAREVYMPDHVCPSCWNDEENHLQGCSRGCSRCGFTW